MLLLNSKWNKIWSFYLIHCFIHKGCCGPLHTPNSHCVAVRTHQQKNALNSSYISHSGDLALCNSQPTLVSKAFTAWKEPKNINTPLLSLSSCRLSADCRPAFVAGGSSPADDRFFPAAGRCAPGNPGLRPEGWISVAGSTEIECVHIRQDQSHHKKTLKEGNSNKLNEYALNCVKINKEEKGQL